MSAALDFISLLTRCILELKTINPKFLFLGVLFSAFLAVIIAWRQPYSSRLWYKPYQPKFYHFLISFCLAPIMFFCFLLLFTPALNHLENAVKLTISYWRLTLGNNEQWTSEAHCKSWNEIKKLGKEDFTNPEYSKPCSTIPLSDQESRLLLARIYADATYENFEKTHSFLGKILSADVGTIKNSVKNDINNYFTNIGHTIPTKECIDYSAKYIQNELDEKAARVVYLAYMLVITSLLFSLIVPLLVVTWDARKFMFQK